MSWFIKKLEAQNKNRTEKDCWNLILFLAEFNSFYRIQLAYHALKLFEFPVKIYWNIISPKKAHHPEIEMWENVKERFIRQLILGYMLVIAKIRFENLIQIFAFR